jgi:DNA-directed RNA polymerase I, II, and III subunit RPABC2
MDEGGRADLLDAGEAVPGGTSDPSKRITTRFMTKYERARILGVRALQIAYVL